MTDLTNQSNSTQDTEDVVGPPPIPNPSVSPGARFSPAHEALTFLRANRDTHSRWAEYFEQNPAIEAEYIATGVWEGAADQRRIEREYNAAIATFERTEADRQSLSDRIDEIGSEETVRYLVSVVLSYTHADEGTLRCDATGAINAVRAALHQEATAPK